MTYDSIYIGLNYIFIISIIQIKNKVNKNFIIRVLLYNIIRPIEKVKTFFFKTPF